MSAACVPSEPCGSCEHCVDTEEGRDARLRFSGVTADALMRRTFPPVEWVLPGVIPAGYVVLAGPPKLGKSWLALQLGLAASSGGHALGRIQVPARVVVYFALEDSERRLQDRIGQLVGTESVSADLVLVVKVKPGEIVATIRAYLRRHRGALVLLDTLGRVMPPAVTGQTAYERDYAVGAALKSLADEHDATIVAVHHSRKMGATDFLDLVLGSQGIAGAADTIIVVQRERGQTDALLNVTGRDVEEATYAVTLERGIDWTLCGADLHEAARAAVERRDSIGLGDRSAAIVGYVRARAPESVSAKEVATAKEIVERYGSMSVDDSGRYLRRLAEMGKLTRQTRGRYSIPLSETSELSESDSNVVPLFDETDETDETDTPVGGDQ